MLDANPIRRLKDTNPQLEVWWDSSPLVYADWLAGAGRDHRDARLFDLVPGPDGQTLFAPDSLLDGATTNQPLTWQVLEKYPEVWAEWLAAQRASAGNLDAREAMWRTHIEIAARGADMLAPIFEATDRRRGQICCQVDPRDLTDLPAMLAQARRIHAARPNIMVKLPGTAEGIEAVRILTAEGIPTNVTLGFTVAQLVATGEAAQAGLAEARQRGTDLRNWRSCAVMMLGRYEDAPPFKEQAAERGIELSEADRALGGHRDLPQGPRPVPGARLSVQADGRVHAPRPDGGRRAARLASGEAGRRKRGADGLPEYLRGIPGELSGVAYRPADRRTGAWGCAGAAVAHPLFC